MANNNAKIKFLSGQYAGSEIELTPFTAIVLGRNPAVSNFVFSNENISRKHCSIQYNPNDRRFAVSDYSSSGTYINNVKRMQQGSVEYLNGGDTIKLGRTDEIIQLIAPQRFENERGASDQDIYDDDEDDRATQKMSASQAAAQPQLTVRGGSEDSYNAGNSEASVQNQVNNNQYNGQFVQKVSCTLGTIGLIFAGAAFLVCLISLIYILATDAQHFAPACVVYINNWGGSFEFIAVFAFVGLILGIVQLSKNVTKDAKIKNIGTVAIVLAVVAMLLFSYIYMSAASCPKRELIEYGIGQAGESLDDMLNELFQ